MGSINSYLLKQTKTPQVRKMHTMRAVLNKLASKGSQISGSTTSATISRGYAKYTCNEAEQNPTDPKSLSNNPWIFTKNGHSFRHTEVQKAFCGQEDCEEKKCTSQDPCEPEEYRVSIANFTTKKTAPTAHGTVVPDIHPNRMDGKPGSQHGFVFDEPHQTAITPENTQYTQTMDNNPGIVDKLESIIKAKQPTNEHDHK